MLKAPYYCPRQRISEVEFYSQLQGDTTCDMCFSVGQERSPRNPEEPNCGTRSVTHPPALRDQLFLISPGL